MSFTQIILSLLFITPNTSAAYYNLFDLAVLNISSEHHGNNYDRARHFGRWTRVNNNCYDTRNYILARYSSVQVRHYRSRPCKVKSGLWRTQYSAIPQTATTPRAFHVDHLVPLKEAFVSGANKWSKSKRCHYNNFTQHPEHLVLVTSHENLRKGDRGPESYMPPNPNIRCEYLKQWMVVKIIWQMSFDSREFEAIRHRFAENNCNFNAFFVDEYSLARLQAIADQPINSCM